MVGKILCLSPSLNIFTKRKERERIKYTPRKKDTCSFSENERDDELVTNPFADSSGGKDSDWNPGNESENMSDSNCITKLCDDKGVKDEFAHCGVIGCTTIWTCAKTKIKAT
ncbi:hypothetical protein PoB_002006900 [Plakobranchus ocellatus]|uniref:Uncharacterized protein n=1 Tax=Plakobranchus ocellatus TaxID=259542 RepID=A0AAV3ZI54_9GAST|nr:hypothetical protein PoB_002006900 [Plakobranchus ocellatus]